MELQETTSLSVSVKDSNDLPVRETWSKKIDFLLSMIGFAVDLSNIWRFPFYCYKNGGGAFLIPYFLMLGLSAIPLFFMELILGQFHRQGPITVWKIAPLFSGLGWAECLISYWVAFYYNVIIAWSFFYFFHSFTAYLAWTSCGHSYNTAKCSANFQNITNSMVSSANEFYERGVLGIHESNGIDHVTAPRWQLIFFLMLVFLILYFALWKGVKSSGKVVWVTATLPYVLLSILLVRGLFLPGAMDGIKYFLTPRLEPLAKVQVWSDAAIQIFYSVGAGFGVHLAYASYNKFDNNCQRDCLITVAVNSFTSVFSGFVVFAYLGYMADYQSRKLEDVTVEGPGLVFEVYPEAISTLAVAPLWSALFFIMLVGLGLDSAMGGMEAVLTGLIDFFKPQLVKYRFHREIFTAVVIIGAFLAALPIITPSGLYWFTLLDTSAAGVSLLFVVFVQSIAVAWFYGMNQVNADVEKMLGFKPHIYWRICWKFVSPISLLLIIVASLAMPPPFETTTKTWGKYTFPEWAGAVGWLVALSSMLLVPAFAAFALFRMPGSSWKQKFALAISPEWEHRSIILGKEVKRFQKKHWLSL